MSRISEVFGNLEREGRKGLIPFITAGDPSLDITSELLVELAHSGAALIELGVPFSDPVADGPVIQRASERALRHGFGVDLVLEAAAKALKRSDVPIVLFSYFNPLLQFGLERFSVAAKDAGIAGVLVTDLTPEESGSFGASLREHDIDLIFLAAPTSTDARLQMIADRARGFIYAVSRAGVTGTQEDVSSAAETLVHRIRQFSNLPVAVGFGISNASQVADVLRYADAAVVGSAIVAEIERSSGRPDLVERVGVFTRSLAAVE